MGICWVGGGVLYNLIFFFGRDVGMGRGRGMGDFRENYENRCTGIFNSQSL